jgi:hypothetical protein
VTLVGDSWSVVKRTKIYIENLNKVLSSSEIANGRPSGAKTGRFLRRISWKQRFVSSGNGLPHLARRPKYAAVFSNFG